MSTTSADTARQSGSLSSPASQNLTIRPPGAFHNEAALNLRIVRGPLASAENESILSQYNRLACAAIPTQQFLRWIQGGPEGPAWHAILETTGGEIVGHTSLIPLRAAHDGRCLVAAKSEYSFIREEFRASKIRGFEDTGKLKNLVYIDELFRKCSSEGWGPLLISTPSGFHRVFRSIGCYPVSFPLWECLLVLRPLDAASNTQNLRIWQRMSLWGAGQLQRVVCARAALFGSRAEQSYKVPMSQSPLRQATRSLSFFEDRESLAWRYPEEQYERVSTEGSSGSVDLILKHGLPDRYLRVCQWRLSSGQPTPALLYKLVQLAWKKRASAVRWAVFGEDANSLDTVGRLRRFGFICARRVRTLLINTRDPQFLDPRAWSLADSMFSFDH